MKQRVGHIFIKKYNFIISVVFVIIHITIAQATDLIEVESSLGMHTQHECTQPSCKVNLDLLLNNLQEEELQQNVDMYDKLNQLIKTKSLPQIQNSNTVNVQSSLPSALPQSKAKIIILNKITTKAITEIFTPGDVKFFGNLSVELHQCVQNTDIIYNNHLMLITVFDNRIDDDNLSVFHGWIMSNNPSISTLEHPVYEIIPQSCVSE